MYITIVHGGSAETVCTILYEMIGVIGLNNRRSCSNKQPSRNRSPGVVRRFEKIIDWSFICGNKIYGIEEKYSLFRSIVLTIAHLCQLALTS